MSEDNISFLHVGSIRYLEVSHTFPLLPYGLWLVYWKNNSRDLLNKALRNLKYWLLVNSRTVRNRPEIYLER